MTSMISRGCTSEGMGEKREKEKKEEEGKQKAKT
jgi:hypothetical protein